MNQPCERCVMHLGTGLENYLAEILGESGYRLNEPFFEESSYVRKAELAPGLEIEYERQLVVPVNCLGRDGGSPPGVRREGLDLGDIDWGNSCRSFNRYIENLRLIGHDFDGSEILYQSIENFSDCSPDTMGQTYGTPFWLICNLGELFGTANLLRPIYIMDAPFRMAKKEMADVSAAPKFESFMLPDMSPPPLPDMGPEPYSARRRSAPRTA
jgi:hypothetical protein